jgi:hypothetical protein
MLTFAPDADPTAPGVIYAASNIRPTARGYANYVTPALVPFPGVSAPTISTQASAMYAHQYAPLSGRIIVEYNATNSKFAQITNELGTGIVVTDVSHAALAAANSIAPSFASFGESILVANQAYPIQIQTAHSGAFASISGSPQARTICVHKNFVIAANISGTYGAVTGTPSLFACSGLSNPSTWAPDPATQAYNAPIVERPGGIMYVKPLGNAVAVYKQTGICLARYTENPQAPWAFEWVRGAKGALGNDAGIVDIGDRHIYIGLDDIYMFDGAQSVSLTAGRVRTSLLGFYLGGAVLTPSQIQHNPFDGEVCFPTYGLTYNYLFDRWGAYSYGTLARTVCQSMVNDLDSFAGTLFKVPTMTIGNDGLLYNRIAGTQTSGLSALYNTMSVQCLKGDNAEASMLRRFVPKFSTAPTGTATLAYSRRVFCGGAAVSDGTGNWDSATGRFGITRSAYYHDLTATFPSVASTELLDLQFDFAGDGKRIEGELR